MKLVMAIVSSDDSRDALDRLTKAGFRATVISTTGGFLREGNTTMFLGTDEQKLPQAVEIPVSYTHLTLPTSDLV